MSLLFGYTLIYASVLILVALGGCYCEHSGVINIGLEGIMVVGAFTGTMALNWFGNAPGVVVVLMSFGAAMLGGLVYSMLLAVASINYKADQTLVGTAMNIMSIVIVTIGTQNYNKAIHADNLLTTMYFAEGRKKIYFYIGEVEISLILVFTIIAVLVGGFLLYKTSFGLRLRAVGEHPQAAASVGISVIKMRYIGVFVSGMLGGLGGLAYVTASVVMWKFDYGVAGFGFLALAVVIFGQWNPYIITFVAMLFGLLRALSNVYSGIVFLEALNIPATIYKMMPYIISLFVLIFTSKSSKAPKSEGIPYSANDV